MTYHIPEQLAGMYNKRGVIAGYYAELQGIPVLEAARERYPLPMASMESTLRAIFQSVDLALLNIADLIGRATSDLKRKEGGVAPALVKISWAHGFHRVLIRLSMMPHQLALPCDVKEAKGLLRIADSPAFKAYVDVLQAYDQTLLQQIESGELSVEPLLLAHSLDSNQLNLIHLSRIMNHDTTVWEQNLAEVLCPVEVPSYETFVVSQGMYDTVYDRVLKGDSYFTQFRGLHQIPETLGAEMNDHIEKAILAIRAEQFPLAYEHLRSCNILAEGVISSLPPIVDNLTTSDYHEIRENLGLTSGSHSVCLHYHLFRDLYRQLYDEFTNLILQKPMNGHQNKAAQQAISDATQARFDDPQAFLIYLLSNECLTLRSFIHQWRNSHVHLPRNNLGGNYTKSLTGSPDAISAVRAMRDAARRKDAMLPLAKARGLKNVRLSNDNAPLTAYFDSETSLDNQLLDITGRVTQKRFKQVQERLGVFATKCPFHQPEKRIV